jgi:hypothetical protein
MQELECKTVGISKGRAVKNLTWIRFVVVKRKDRTTNIEQRREGKNSLCTIGFPNGSLSTIYVKGGGGHILKMVRKIAVDNVTKHQKAIQLVFWESNHMDSCLHECNDLDFGLIREDLGLDDTCGKSEFFAAIISRSEHRHDFLSK